MQLLLCEYSFLHRRTYYMKKTMLKKQTALAAAGFVMLAAVPVIPAAAADAPSVLILGDSISAGEGLAEGEYGYYDYIADCTGG